MTPILSDEELISAYRAGDPQAATVLYERYHAQLIVLIRRQRGAVLKAVEDSTDVAQSVLNTLFMQLQGQPVHVEPDDGLWPLLATIAINKIRNRGKFWHRECRDPGRVEAMGEFVDPFEREPSPEDVVVVEEIIANLLRQFSPRRQRIIELMLEGRATREIAAEVGASERTVYETRQAAAKKLQQILTVE